MDVSLRELYNREKLMEDRLIRSKNKFEQERCHKALVTIRNDISYMKRRDRYGK